MEKKSIITRAMSRDGSLRALVVNSRGIVEAARQIHQTSPTATSALGRVLTTAALMGSLLKEKTDTLTLNFRGDGPCGKILAVADYSGNVKGTVSSPDFDAPRKSDGSTDLTAAVGGGTLNVIREEKGAEPFIGVTKIVSGEIARDVAAYYAESEQIPTLLSLGVSTSASGAVSAAGGVFVQLLPGADERVVDIIEANAKNLANISALLLSGRSNTDILDAALDGIEYDVFDEIDVEYACDCSFERMGRALTTLRPVDLYNMLVEDGQIETVCRFCGKKYVFHGEDIERAREDKNG